MDAHRAAFAFFFPPNQTIAPFTIHNENLRGQDLEGELRGSREGAAVVLDDDTGGVVTGLAALADVSAAGETSEEATNEGGIHSFLTIRRVQSFLLLCFMPKSTSA